jgi:hypothetical protein
MAIPLALRERAGMRVVFIHPATFIPQPSVLVVT